MEIVLRSNNLVELSYAEALLNDAGIETVILDDHMSVLDGSMVILPRRLMVGDEDRARALSILKEGLKALPPDKDET